jgi:hypothetical protein
MFIMNPDMFLDHERVHLAPFKFLEAYVCNPREPECGNIVRPSRKHGIYLMFFDHVTSLPDEIACMKWYNSFFATVTAIARDALEHGITCPDGVDINTVQETWNRDRWRQLRCNLEHDMYQGAEHIKAASSAKWYKCLERWRSIFLFCDSPQYKKLKMDRIYAMALLDPNQTRTSTKQMPDTADRPRVCYVY